MNCALTTPIGLRLLAARHLLSALLLCTTAAATDTLLYTNGPDPGDIGYWAINHGSAVSNSFMLSGTATIRTVVFSIYDANDRNTPLTTTWAITTQRFGGTVVAGGIDVPLIYISRIFDNRFLFSQWEMKFLINVTLPPGTYWLQIQDVVTRWRTWAFWGETDGVECWPSQQCPSSAYFWDPLVSRGVAPIGSESFELWGVALKTPFRRRRDDWQGHNLRPK
jgi:hypothetical protein